MLSFSRLSLSLSVSLSLSLSLSLSTCPLFARFSDLLGFLQLVPLLTAHRQPQESHCQTHIIGPAKKRIRDKRGERERERERERESVCVCVCEIKGESEADRLSEKEKKIEKTRKLKECF